MFKIKCILKSCCFLFLTTVSYAAEYKALLIGTESIPGEWSVSSINDKGQVVGYHIIDDIDGYQYNPPPRDHEIYIYDPSRGISFIKTNNNTFVFDKIIFNNNNQIFGNCNNQRSCFMWNKASGFRIINFDQLFDRLLTQIDQNNTVTTIAVNDLGQMIGEYYMHSTGARPFLWDNGIIYDMGTDSEFAKKFESLGYNITGMHLNAINNKGEIAGSFSYKKYNRKKDRMMDAGFKLFFWDGDIHVIEDEIFYRRYSSSNILKLNNNGVLLIQSYINDVPVSFLWSLNSILQSRANFSGTSLNDELTVLGYISRDPYVWAIWKNGKCNTIADLLDVESIFDLAPPYGDSCSIEGIENLIEINNKEQIIGTCRIWGENHPCILQPVQQ